ncbi:hypothetical protein SEUCBS139899_002479 [Sporothrix eucalyptigena]|uniref:Cytochrome c oxidase assembly protein COX20, mitochondrial n=1 Tax=Sporothrix eucalyptigena TaxID=1812306 RepID=A0ABP0B445_9PEZI
MADSYSSSPATAQPSKTAPTAAFGTQHFDRAPTSDDLKTTQNQAAAEAAAQQPSPPTGQPATQGPPQPQRASVSDAVKSIKASDFLNVYQVPCARQGFLTGIGGGAVVGALRYIAGGKIPKAANWAVGAFALGGIVSFEVCQASRRAEVAKMKRVVEVYDKKQADLRAKEAEKARHAAAETARAAETKRLEEAAAKAARPWYKFW